MTDCQECGGTKQMRGLLNCLMACPHCNGTGRQPAEPAEMPKPVMTVREYMEWSDHRIQDLEAQLSAARDEIAIDREVSFLRARLNEELKAGRIWRTQLVTVTAERDQYKRKYLEADSRILADEERCKLTGDALSAEAELSALTAEVERLRSALVDVLHEVRPPQHEDCVIRVTGICNRALHAALAASAGGRGP